MKRIHCDVCLRPIEDYQHAMVFWDIVDPAAKVVVANRLLVAHKGGRHQGSVGCDPNFRYSWELTTFLADADSFLYNMRNVYNIPRWATVKLLATCGREIADQVGPGK